MEVAEDGPKSERFASTAGNGSVKVLVKGDYDLEVGFSIVLSAENHADFKRLFQMHQELNDLHTDGGRLEFFVAPSVGDRIGYEKESLSSLVIDLWKERE